MTSSIAEQLRWARAELAAASAQLDAEVLLAHVLEKNRSYLYAWPERDVPADLLARFHALIEARQQGQPVAYLLGSQEFWSLSLRVTPATLIPRPETELLVDAVLHKYCGGQPLSVLDAGTGSGAIAIAIAKERPHWSVFAGDFSLPALQVARANAVAHHVDIGFFNSDWLAAVRFGVLDVIVSNPPYIAEGDKHLSALRYEPQTALVAAQNGLADIRKIAGQASGLLKPRGTLYIEHGYDQAELVRQIFHDNGFIEVITVRDYAGCDRFTCGVKNADE